MRVAKVDSRSEPQRPLGAVHVKGKGDMHVWNVIGPRQTAAGTGEKVSLAGSGWMGIL